MLCLMNQFEYHSSDIQDINGLLQLKQNLNLGSNIEISINDSLEFIEEEGYLFIEYQRDNKLYRRKIYG